MERDRQEEKGRQRDKTMIKNGREEEEGGLVDGKTANGKGWGSCRSRDRGAEAD